MRERVVRGVYGAAYVRCAKWGFYLRQATGDCGGGDGGGGSGAARCALRGETGTLGTGQSREVEGHSERRRGLARQSACASVGVA